MNAQLFFISLVITLIAVTLPMIYLRGITRRVLLELCDKSDTGAEFWLRIANVLAIVGALILVLIFGRAGADWLDTLRITLLLSLVGVFVTVMFIASNIWRRVAASTNAAPR